MTKQEFENRINSTVSTSEYSVIEYVYTFHPSISNTEGKEQIAKIYQIGGMRLIKDMIPTAQKAERLEEELRRTNEAMNLLRKQYDNLKSGLEEE